MGRKKKANIWVVPAEKRNWDYITKERHTICGIKEGEGFLYKSGFIDDFGRLGSAMSFIPFRRIPDLDGSVDPKEYVGKRITITKYWKERNYDVKDKLVGYNAVIEKVIEINKGINKE